MCACNNRCGSPAAPVGTAPTFTVGGSGPSPEQVRAATMQSLPPAGRTFGLGALLLAVVAGILLARVVR